MYNEENEGKRTFRYKSKGGIDLEEDIEIIEEMIEVYCSCSVDEEGFDMRVDIAFMKKECKALENLLTRYKQLEEENTQLKTITQEYNSYLQDSNCDTKIIIADSEYFANGFFKENFIPKSKVKEKIEELKNGTYDAKIILQQLLED